MKRILIKLSGEALLANKKSLEPGEIYDADFVNKVAGAIKTCCDEGYEIALVIGAGNIWRGRQGTDMDRVSADRMGMLATAINAIYMKDALEHIGLSAVVMTAVPMAPFAENYSSDAARAALAQGKVVILGAGLGIPFLSTDTTAAVRAAEVGAEAMFMAKNVSHICAEDPRVNPNAKKFDVVKASEVLALNLKAIDSTATAFCLSVGMPIQVFGLFEPDDIVRAVRGEKVGTLITAE